MAPRRAGRNPGLVVLVPIVIALVVMAGACDSAHPSSAAPPGPTTGSPPTITRTRVRVPRSTTPSPTSTTTPATTVPVAALGDGGPVTLAATHAGVLSGKTITIDPGHNGGNFRDPGDIDSLVWNGRENEACDTTGTETDNGYTEALFNWNVAQWVAGDLRAEGAHIILTRSSNTGVGPCITERTELANSSDSAAAVSIHADGGPATGRGFAILEPVADGPNDAVIDSSAVLGSDLRAAFSADTGEPVSTYDGVDGIEPRDDLAGTNLTTVPKVFIECGNMRNPTDAAILTDPIWQQKAGAAIAAGLTAFLAAP